MRISRVLLNEMGFGFCDFGMWRLQSTKGISCQVMSWHLVIAQFQTRHLRLRGQYIVHRQVAEDGEADADGALSSLI